MERLCAAVQPHWQKDAAHLPGLNCVDFGLRDIYQMFIMAGQKRVEDAVALIFKNQEQVSGYPSLFHAYLHGASVVINHAEATFPPLLQWCQELRQRWVPHAYMNLYLTPPGAQTVRPHSDDRDVVLLQCLGRKKWRVMEPVVPFPYAHEQVGKDKPLDESCLPRTVLSCTVEPGDALYMPRGFVHVGESTTEGPSLHLTLAIATHDWSYAKLLADIAFAACASRLTELENVDDETAKLNLAQDEDAREVESMLADARAKVQALDVSSCCTAKEVAAAVQAKLDTELQYKRAVPFSVFFASGGPQPTTAEEDAAPPAAGDSDAQTFDDRSVQRVVKAIRPLTLREAYRERLAKHNTWHDKLLALWQADGSKCPPSSSSSSSGARPGGLDGRWVMPPRLAPEVTLAKAGRFRFSCKLDDDGQIMLIEFEDERGRVLKMYTLPMYLDVMKFVEKSSAPFAVADLPISDPVGQLCFAAVALHNGIFVDV
mmetsp:Transcript_40269/g.92589  ORF Transcript_40269/g.92589 Transcript_40269/m.92589 type:complete len:486 (-) Transcript_40269:67-1524(-)